MILPYFDTISRTGTCSMSRAPPMTAEHSATDSPDRELLDRVFRLLRDRRRCYLYVYLQFHPSDEVSVNHLVEQIMAWEQTLGAPQVSRDDILIALTHNHLPKLADAGVIDYDREAGRVHWQKQLSQLEGLISTVTQAQRAAEQQ